jgi:hypothetical protein
MTLAGAAMGRGDEGMWLFNHPPREMLRDKYNFDPTDAWLNHVQQSAVRFNSGGSGSFLSSEGLVMTNHHVGADALQKLSSAKHDYLQQGFHAKTRAEEIRCLDLELNVLIAIQDVTARVSAAVTAGMSSAEAEKARRAVMNTIEKESLDKTGLRSDVVTLYHGGEYHLYRYKKYTDVRLVFAPEKQIAFFGGDADNFEYPRYDLDICFFRAYENDKPAKIEHYLKWSPTGAGDGELVFVAGNPGHTDRLNTVDHLEYLRDRSFPTSMGILYRREVLLKAYSERSRENARRAADDYFGIQNSRKAKLGGLAALQDPAIMDRKRANQQSLREAIRSNAKLADGDQAWAQVADAMNTLKTIQIRKLVLEDMAAFDADLFHIARGVLRMAQETAKPNTDRLREYRESNLESVKQRLYSTAPIYLDLETIRLEGSLSMLIEMLGADDALVVQILDGKSPKMRAAELVQGTKLQDVALRKQLAEGGLTAVEASEDPLLALARLVDPAAREVRKKYESQVDEPLRQAYAKIAQARFALYGKDMYPDATFTLRLAFGVVRGYRAAGHDVPPWTTIGGAYQHAAEHDNAEPFQLPASWIAAKSKLDLTTPLNFICTADIIGGNSGSPVINRPGELVGIIFDGNIESLALDFVYSDDVARAVSVHSSGIVEALRQVYRADKLVDELLPPAKNAGGSGKPAVRGGSK